MSLIVCMYKNKSRKKKKKIFKEITINYKRIEKKKKNLKKVED